MLISKSEYSVTEVALSKYETAHGFTFPQEYRAFLLKYNGGETPGEQLWAAATGRWGRTGTP